MAKKPEEYATSIDAAFNLFMDTIANAFGGIVLIAMAVCILLQLAGDESNDRDEKAKEALVAELGAIERENEKLRALTQDLAGEISNDTTTATLARTLRDRKKEEEDRKARALAEVAKLDKELAELQSKTTGQLKASAFATKFMTLKREYDELLKQRYKKTSSTASATNKQQLPLLITGGRLVELLVTDPRTGKKEFNSKEVDELVNEKGRRYFRPRPNKGFKIEDTPECKAKIAAMFSSLNPQRSYIGFSVWPDSYKEYLMLRKAATEAKLGFYLVLMQKDAAVSAAGPSEEMGGGASAAQ